MRQRRKWAMVVLCALLLAGSFAAFLFLVKFRENAWLQKAGTLQYAVCVAGVIVVFVGTLLVGHVLVDRAPSLMARLRTLDPWPFMSLRYNRDSILCAAAFVFVLWIPWIVLQYPVAMIADTFNQLYQFQTSSPTFYSTMGTVVDASYIDHHPVFDTLLFGSFWSLGEILGNQNLGLFAFSLCQSLAGAGVLAASVCYLDRLGVPKPLRLVSLLFVALYPPVPLWCATMVKDSLFAISFGWFFLLYVEAFLTRGAALTHRGFLLAFMAAATLCVLTKKPGIYIVGVSLLVLLAYCRKGVGRARLASVLVAVLLLSMLVVPTVLYPAIGGVAPGGRQESFGFALQQVVTVVRVSDDLTVDERSDVEAVLDLPRALECYEVETVDPVKNSTYPQATRGDYLRFVGAWVRIGLRHPLLYARSQFSVSAKLLAPGAFMSYNPTCDQEQSWVETFYNNDPTKELNLSFRKPRPLSAVSQQMFEAYHSLASTPPLNIFGSRGFFGGWLPALCVCLAYVRSRRSLAAYTPVVVSVLFVLVSPAASSRYVVPLLFVAVFELGLLYHFLCAKDPG